jgi:MscS family membrane protein
MNIVRIALAIVLLAALPAASAAESPPPQPTAAPPASVTEEPVSDTPFQAVRGYLEAANVPDWAQAAAYLDLSELPEAERATAGPELARHLKIVLDRRLWIDLDQLSRISLGQIDDGLPAHLERVGAIPMRAGHVDILLERVPGTTGGLRWLIAAATVREIPRLWDEHGFGRLVRWLPPSFFDIRFLEVQLWQWLALPLVLLAAILAGFASWVALRPLALRLARLTPSRVDDRVVLAVGPPFRLLLALATTAILLGLLGLAAPAARGVRYLLLAAFLLTLTWLGLRLIDVTANVLAERATGDRRKAALSMVPMIQRVAKFVFLAIAFIVVLQNLGVAVGGLIAGVGVVGAALALAAQKTIENLFGGVSLALDQPIRIGDFCQFGARQGTVEAIGMRSTTIRTLDRTVVTVPNAQFSNEQIENFGVRDRVRLFAVIGLRYETSPDQMRHLLAELRALLASHPKVDPQDLRVRLVGFGQHSLDVELFAYIRTTDWLEFLAVREEIYLRIMEAVAAAGTSFAIPSRTAYLARDHGIDAERAAAAGRAGAARREQPPEPAGSG